MRILQEKLRQMGRQLYLARLEEEGKAWVLDLSLQERQESLLMDNSRVLKKGSGLKWTLVQ